MTQEEAKELAIGLLSRLCGEYIGEDLILISADDIAVGRTICTIALRGKVFTLDINERICPNNALGTTEVVCNMHLMEYMPLMGSVKPRGVYEFKRISGTAM